MQKENTVIAKGNMNAARIENIQLYLILSKRSTPESSLVSAEFKYSTSVLYLPFIVIWNVIFLTSGQRNDHLILIHPKTDAAKPYVACTLWESPTSYCLNVCPYQVYHSQNNGFWWPLMALNNFLSQTADQDSSWQMV